jgi:hypothetical protein
MKPRAYPHVPMGVKGIDALRVKHRSDTNTAQVPRPHRQGSKGAIPPRRQPSSVGCVFRSRELDSLNITLLTADPREV